MSPQQKLELRLNALLQKDAEDAQDAREAVLENFTSFSFRFYGNY